MKRHTIFYAAFILLAMSAVVYATWPGAGYVSGLRARWADTIDDIRIPLGQHPHLEAWHITGCNAGVVSATECMWAPGGDENWITTAARMKVSSSATADDAGSTGATAIIIYGLDASYDQLVETVVMDGRTQVTTDGTFIRVNKVRCTTAGTGGANAGDIYVYTGAASAGVPDVSTTVYAKILAGWGGSSGAFFTVPNGYTGLLTHFSGSHDAGERVHFDVWYRQSASSCWTIIKHMEFKGTHEGIEIRLPFILDEKSDIKIMASNDDTASNTSDVCCAFHITLINEDLYTDAKAQ